MRELLNTPGMRAFFFLWGGLTISLLGSGLTAFSLGIWIYQQTDSTTQYAVVMFCAALPPLVLLPFVGPFIDRFDRKRLLVACDLVGASATAAVGLLAWLEALSLPWACLIVIVTSCLSALQWPTYSATVTTLVPREHLGRASGMTQLAQAMSQIAAPIVAGALITRIGLTGITAIDFFTFLASAAMILLAAIPRRVASERQRRSYRQDLPVGWRYIMGNPGLAGLLFMFAVTNFCAELATVLFTPFVLTFSTPAALGTIVTIGGIGMLAGGALMTLWGGPKRPALGATIFAGLGGVTIMTAAFTLSIPLLAVIAAAFFFSIPLMSGSSQVVWQRTVPQDIQGRVFATRAAIAMSIVPLASIAAGPLADVVFEPAMAEGGALSGLLGPLVGVGKGRGIAVIFLAAGLLSVAAAVVAALHAPLRGLDHVAGSWKTPSVGIHEAVSMAHEAHSSPSAGEYLAVTESLRADPAE